MNKKQGFFLVACLLALGAIIGFLCSFVPKNLNSKNAPCKEPHVQDDDICIDYDDEEDEFTC